MQTDQFTGDGGGEKLPKWFRFRFFSTLYIIRSVLVPDIAKWNISAQDGNVCIPLVERCTAQGVASQMLLSRHLYPVVH